MGFLPLGPVEELQGASAPGPLEIRVYPGADGEFELYDDSGDGYGYGYGYEQGELATTTLRWDDANSLLHVAAPAGSYPGMPTAVPAPLVVVGPGRGVGPALTVDAPTVNVGERGSTTTLNGPDR